MVEAAYLFGCRSLSHSIFKIGLFTNPFALAGAAAMVLLQLFFTYASPMNALFHSAPLDAGAWWRILAVALFAFFAVELEKWLRFGGGRGSSAAPE